MGRSTRKSRRWHSSTDAEANALDAHRHARPQFADERCATERLARTHRLCLERLEDRLAPAIPAGFTPMQDQTRFDPTSGMTYEVYGPDIPWYYYATPGGPVQEGTDVGGTRTPPLLNTIEGLDFNTTGYLDGLDGFGAIPPDCTGAVGPNHVVGAVNSAIKWTDKAGGNARTKRLGTDFNGEIANAFFDLPGTANDPVSGLFDPRVIYDQYAGRFIVIIAEFQATLFEDPVDSSWLYIGVSHTSDPNDGWNLMRLNTKVTIAGAPTWLDYPALAVDSQAIYITGNFFTFDFQSNPGTRLFILPKGIGTGGIYDPGGTSAATVHDAAGLSGAADTLMIPAHMFGTAPTNVGTFLVRYSGFSSGSIESVSVIRVNNPLTTPTFTHQFITAGDIDVVGPPVPDAGQLNGPIGIDTGDRRTLNAVWRNNGLYFMANLLPTSATPDVAQATAHWWRVNTTNLASLTMGEQGNISGNDIAPDCPTFYGALAVDQFGNIGFGFGASSLQIPTGFYYTIHQVADAPGTVQASAVVAAGQDIYIRTYSGFDNRWGDYFAAAIDPVDGSFWVYGEYPRPRGFMDPNGHDGIWGTRWGHFEIPNAGLKATNIGPVSPNPRQNALASIQVTFSQTLNLGTFTNADLTLTRNGAVVAFTNNETFTQVGSSTTYTVGGLAEETALPGTYVLTVNASTIQNGSNVAGAGTRSETWKVDTAGPQVLDVYDVSPDPITTPLGSIVVLLSEVVDLATFTTADLTLTRNGGNVSFGGNETITRIPTAVLPLYTISGLSEEISITGNYVFSAFGSGINDVAGNSGSGSASDSFTLQLNGPAVVDVLDVAPDPRTTAINSIDVVFSDPILLSSFTVADITLTRNGTPVTFSSNETFTFVSGTTYRVGNLSEETALGGTYVFTVIGSGITDAALNAGTSSASDTWVVDLAGPTVVDVLNITPDPRNSAVASIDVLFSELLDLSTFTVADLTLTRDGNAVTFGGNETFVLLSGTTYRIGGLSEETALAGAYFFAVNAAGINDALGNPGTGSNSDSWVMDLTGPTIIDVIDVAPDPRNTTVSTVDVVFSEPIQLASFTAADISLTRNGSPVGFSGNESFTLVSGSTYRIGGLAEETALSGSYVLTVNGAGIADPAGNAGAGAGVDSWITDVAPPTIVSVGPVTPNPRNTVVGAVDIVFSELINLATFTVADLALTRNGLSVSFSGNETFVFVAGTTYTIGGLTEETGVDGAYVLTATAAGILDLVGNAGTGNANAAWTADFTAPSVVDVLDVAPDPRNAAVAFIDVTFSEAIQLASFSVADLTLTRTGNPVAFSGNESFSLLSGTTYRIGGLTEETNADGIYTLVVQGAGVLDLVGNAGVNSAQDSFVIDVTPPTVVQVGPVVPDPRNTPVASIDVVFSEPIILSTLTIADIALTRNGSPVGFSGNETFAFVAGSTYSIGGLVEETGASGNYVLTVQGGGVLDPFFNSGVGSANATWSNTLSADNTAPAIVGVFFDGSTWSSGFRAALGNSSGFVAADGANQLVDLPWNTVNVVRIQFSEDVVVDQNDLAVRGLNVANYAIAGFAYDNVNFIGSWTLQSAIDTDRVILDLDGDSGTATADSAGNKLAGSWTEGVSTFPTAGAAAVDFLYRFIVGVGDADRNGLVRNADLNLVRNNLFVDAGQPGYNPFADIDGNGQVRNADLNATRAHLFVDPPPGPGPNRPAGGGNRSRAALNARTDRSYAASAPGEYTRTSTLRRSHAGVAAALLDEVFSAEA